MNNNFLNVGCDLETIPTQNPDQIENIMTQAKSIKVSPPATKEAINAELKEPFAEATLKGMKLDGLKAIWAEQHAVSAVEAEFDRLYRKTSFSAGDGGEIVAASFMALDRNEHGEPLQAEPNTRFRHKGGVSEADMLKPVVAWLDEVYEWARSANKQLRFVGANVYLFDFRFLIQRCLILGIPLPKFGLISSKYDRTKYFDVLSVWNFYDERSSISLDRLCKTLNVESPKNDDIGEINGAMVWDIWRNEGEAGAERIAKYNARDVIALRPLFEKLVQMEGC